MNHANPNHSSPKVFYTIEELKKYLQSAPEGQFVSITLEPVTSDNEALRGIEKDIRAENTSSRGNSESSNKIARNLQSAGVGDGGGCNGSC